MSGEKIGYTRVSSADQNAERQLEGVEVDRVFADTTSGKDTNRQGLEEMLSYIREGDTVIVHSMDRLARNVDDLRQLVKQMLSKGVTVRFHKESLDFHPQGSHPMAELMLSVLGAFAEFERKLIKERQREGIALAKKRGVYKGRSRALSPEQVDTIKQRIADGEKVAALAKDVGVSRETIYKYIREAGGNKPDA